MPPFNQDLVVNHLRLDLIEELDLSGGRAQRIGKMVRISATANVSEEPSLKVMNAMVARLQAELDKHIPAHCSLGQLAMIYTKDTLGRRQVEVRVNLDVNHH